MKKIKLYLDTSIPSAYYNYQKAIRQLITQKWFENESSNYELYISVITVEEIEELDCYLDWLEEKFLNLYNSTP